MDNRRRFFNKASSTSGESSGSYTVVLNGQWQKSTTISNPDSTLYEGVYESFSNEGINNSGAIMYIDIDGLTNFKLYIRSYAEPSFDYVMVSQLDQTITYSTSYSNTTLIKAHTRGNQKSGNTINDYTLVEFTNIDGGSHRISIIYRKDSSAHSGDDRGYLLIPLGQGSAEEGGNDGEVDIDTTYSIQYTSSTGNIVTPHNTNVFGATITNNVYINGKGYITFDGPITTIGYYAFQYCTILTSVNIPDSVTEIGESAFEGCDSLTSVNIPDSVTSIGRCAFYGCGSLTEFTGKFAEDNGRILVVDGVLTAFAPAGITEYNIPDSVTTIGDSAFHGCHSLTSVTIPDSVTTIGEDAFAYCSSLTSVTIPDSVTSIGERAFYYCSRLTSVNIPDSVTTIGDWAFYECYNLTSVTIGDSVTTIGEAAFAYCDSLTSVYCKAINPPRLLSRLVSDSIRPTIYVPTTSVETYKSATNWESYANYIVGYEFS